MKKLIARLFGLHTPAEFDAALSDRAEAMRLNYERVYEGEKTKRSRIILDADKRVQAERDRAEVLLSRKDRDASGLRTSVKFLDERLTEATAEIARLTRRRDANGRYVKVAA